MTEAAKILVLDDEQNITTLLKEALSLDGFEVHVSNDVEEFQRIDASESIDLYLLDLILPHANGLEIAKEIRRESDAGIIILTGQSSEIDVVLGLEIGADDYIAKPFRTRELRARVGSVFRRLNARPAHADAAVPHNSPSAPVSEHDLVRFGNWTMNKAARSVRHVGGATLELTTSEFDVLAYLVDTAGRVVTRNQIIDAIRGEDWASYDRLVDGLISRIRRKLDRIDDAPSPIKTIRGVGYLFDVEK